MVPFMILQYGGCYSAGIERVVGMQAIPLELLVHDPDEVEAATNPITHTYPNGVVDHHAEAFE